MNEPTLSRDEAIAIVQDWLRREREPSAGIPMGVVTARIAESDEAFIVPWQSQAYLDGDRGAMIVGTYPVIVDKHSGELVHGRPVIAFDIQLAEYGASRARDR
ncbi:MAG TPA: YrhB domain-containing protein [Candidatus Dormibacteraeota bacterium]